MARESNCIVYLCVFTAAWTWIYLSRCGKDACQASVVDGSWQLPDRLCRISNPAEDTAIVEDLSLRGKAARSMCIHGGGYLSDSWRPIVCALMGSKIAAARGSCAFFRHSCERQL